MITVLYTTLTDGMKPDWMADKMQGLPVEWQQKIKRYKNPNDQLLRLCGRLLLIHLLEQTGYRDKVQLTDLKYTPTNKPYFDIPFDFNISHAGNRVVCAGITNSKIGVDIEKINTLDITLLKDQYDPAEWTHITNSPDPLTTLYMIWTRKEAILKASGAGVHGHFTSVDTLSGVVLFNGISYHLNNLDISDGYAGHIATDTPSAYTLTRIQL